MNELKPFSPYCSRYYKLEKSVLLSFSFCFPQTVFGYGENGKFVKFMIFNQIVMSRLYLVDAILWMRKGIFQF